MKSSHLGYPRIGANRQWKKALEQFWAGKLPEDEFVREVTAIRLDNLKVQQDKGIELIPVGDFSLYDHVLDTAVMFGIVPKRFAYEGGPVPLATYFAMARGNKEAAACEMTKWFNTNYHYIVPELNDTVPVLTENRPLAAYREARQQLGIEGKPVILGPLTFVKLSKGYGSTPVAEVVATFIPLYAQLLQELESEGVQWVQVDEPILSTTVTAGDVELLNKVYTELKQAAPKLSLLLQTYFDAVDYYEQVIALPVQGIGLDFLHDRGRNLKQLQKHGFPQDKVLAAGLIDGRNIWRADLDEAIRLAGRLAAFVPADRLIVQPSSSLLHVPVSTRSETDLDPVLKDALAFAEEKLEELAVLKQALENGPEAVSGQLASSREARRQLNASPERNRTAIQQAIAQITKQKFGRALPFADRRPLQQAQWQLPLLPTTTIGSFPQTAEVRQARQKWRKGEWSESQYSEFIEAQIRTWIELQEQLGIDVLVHGEFERTDMVEFFGEKLAGFAFTRNGWVQSYGSRCVKPPVIYGDVAFTAPMTVTESVFAQSLTKKPVKGMLTGPVTILNWSFVRDDLSREQVAYQIALALRAEVEALEQAGIEMIQVDEPAVREGLPLKQQDKEAYIQWAVDAFRLSTSTVKDTTQIHTHMCYCEFHDMIGAISDMDADVISIETSRSHGELIHSFEETVYGKGIGLGVYDIHSPRVPAVEEMVSMIDRSLRVLDPSLFWINPDCGLKTRGMDETVKSLRNMVQAAEAVRAKLQ
ncbi:5-methyltetrahydropteroyltriglutamate--homocysteine S-methyltransferase [Paenibacillus sp. y28]|uniref:5-methyltetrahydropteroyltriglutamate-- homocysteine S-methyltransferase n=1 Tax=Paenibacillus sp. y28 TaxID=3129110 RepID=UPI003015D30E